jgi:hypothetical protein
MSAVILLLCIVVGLTLYFLVVRPFLIPLEWRIPNGRAYRPTLGVPR